MASTPTPFVSSGADLVASVPSDFFSDVSADTSASTETQETSAADTDSGADAPFETEPIEAPGSIENEPEPEETAPAAEETPEGTTAAATPATPAEELPEGVLRGKDRNGKPGLFVEEDRWKSIYGNHQLAQQVSDLMGEPATAEAIGLRQEAFVAQERLYNDLTSGDAATQGKVLDFFLDEMSRAREEGEIGSDAAVPFSESVYKSLREKSPDGYANLRLLAARDLVNEMFEVAGQAQDESLWLSAQHFARALSGVAKDVTDIAQIRTIADRMKIPFYSKAEMQSVGRGGDPTSRLHAEIQQLRSQLDGRHANSQAAQFDEWANGMTQSVSTAILDDAVKPALASVQDAWKQFPDDYRRLVVDPLHREVARTLKQNPALQETIKRLDGQARRSTSASKRQEIGQQIQQAYVNRAKLAADAAKKPILEFAAKWLKEQADRTHARHEGAQNRTATRGPASAVPRSVLPSEMPKMNGTYDPKIALEQMVALLK